MPLTQAQIVDKVRARLSPHQIAEIDASEDGPAMLQTYAAMFYRAGLIRSAKNRARLLRNATGPKKAISTVTITWSEATGADGYELAPQVLFATKSGVRFNVLEAIHRDDAEAPGVQVVAVEAEFAGFDGLVDRRTVREWAIADLYNRASVAWNGGTDAAKDEFLAGVRDGTITFSMDTDPEGGANGTLDLRGKGRGVPRLEGETDERYMPRIQVPPELGTPDGILAGVNQALGGAVAELAEYWEVNPIGWGTGGWGVSPWMQKRMAIVWIPDAADIPAIQALVNRLRCAGYYVLVLEAA